MTAFPGDKPSWIIFDCYSILIQWDEGLFDAIGDNIAVLSYES